MTDTTNPSPESPQEGAQSALEPLTPFQAKRLIRAKLVAMGLNNTIMARTVRFTDLARASAVVVTVQGWRPDPRAANLQDYATRHGFQVDFQMMWGGR